MSDTTATRQEREAMDTLHAWHELCLEGRRKKALYEETQRKLDARTEQPSETTSPK